MVNVIDINTLRQAFPNIHLQHYSKRLIDTDKKKPIHVVEPHTSQSHLVDRFDEKWDGTYYWWHDIKQDVTRSGKKDVQIVMLVIL